jgi:hypothetical protein
MTEKHWLEQNRFYYQIDETRLQSIFYFSLIWNIYEKELCGKNAGIKTDPPKHSNIFANKADPEIFLHVFDYFKNRYVLNGQATHYFITFEFNSEPIKNEVFGYLSSANTTKEEKLKALLYIAFRLRNNLFHGEKQVEKLYEQNENFRQINLLLMNLIDKK